MTAPGFRYAQHWARVYNRPLLMHPASLDAMLPALDGVLRGETRLAPAVALAQTDPEARHHHPLLRAVGDTAIIQVHGVLTQRGRYDLAECQAFTGYNDISAALHDAMSFDAGRIVLDIDSPGGEVAGLFDLVDEIAAIGGDTKVYAVINDLGCSAAYAIASAAHEVILTRTALAGSIGVVMRHVDMSAWLAKEGVQITHIYAGDQKVDGHPYAPLPDAVRERFQAEIDGLYQLFVDTVAVNRHLARADVIATQAGVYRGEAAITAGLADRIATLDELLYDITPSTRAGWRIYEGTHAMTTPRAAEAARSARNAETDATILNEGDLIDAGALAPMQGARLEQDLESVLIDSAYADGARSERLRIAAILEDGGDDQRALAEHLALHTDTDRDTAAGILSAARQAARPAAGPSQFERMMARVGSSGVNAGGEPGQAGPQSMTRQQFDGLDHQARAQFIRAGGRVIETVE